MIIRKGKNEKLKMAVQSVPKMDGQLDMGPGEAFGRPLPRYFDEEMEQIAMMALPRVDKQKERRPLSLGPFLENQS